MTTHKGIEGQWTDTLGPAPYKARAGLSFGAHVSIGQETIDAQNSGTHATAQD